MSKLLSSKGLGGVLILGTLLTAAAASGAYTWTERQPAGNADKWWNHVAMSPDGSTMIGAVRFGRLYTSADSGVNWTERQPAGAADLQWFCAAVSDDGQTMIVGSVAVGGRLYTSADGGANWTERQPAGAIDRDWSRVAISADGSTMLAASSSGRLYMSTNAGVNWAEVQPAGNVDLTWYAAAMSDDATKMVVAAQGDYVYLSDDSGSNWTPAPAPLDGTANWVGASMSDDGSVIMVGADVGRLYLSTDGGTSWAEVQPAGDSDQSWYCLAVAGDGHKLMAGIANGRLYTSVDDGATWTEEQPAGASDKTWYSAALTTDAAGAIVAAVNGRLYTGSGPVQATVTTAAVAADSATSATAGGDVTADGGATVTARGVCWNTTGSPTVADDKTTDGTGTGAFTSLMTGLAGGTTYYVRAYATNSEGTVYGTEDTVTTPDEWSNNLIANAGAETQNLSGWTVTANGGDGWAATGLARTGSYAFAGSYGWCEREQVIDLVAAGFTTTELDRQPAVDWSQWVRAREVDVVYWVKVELLDGSMTVIDSWNSGTQASPVSMAANTTWTEESTSFSGYGAGLRYIRVSDGSRDDIGWAGNYGAHFDDASLVLSLDAPTVTTASVTGIMTTGAACGGNVTGDGGANVTARGVCWSTIANPTTADSITSDGTGTGAFASTIAGLTPGQTYHVRAYATNSEGTSYGNDVEFTAVADPPTVTTTAVSNIMSDSAESGGNVTADGGAAVTARGVCWNTTGTPTTADDKTSDGTGTGAFASAITGLAPGTTYYVRAYATNSGGTGYGGEETFTTDAVLPTVTTAVVSDITPTGATSGGEVTDDGGAAITARGICWSTTADPTIADGVTSDGTGTGAFVSAMTGLTPGQTYHVRAYATNSVGTSYGADVEFTAGANPPTVVTADVTDVTITGATSGGEVTDDGGGAVTARGVCWNTTGTPTIADSTTTDGTGTGSFVSTLTGLGADTTYYVRAYATNGGGTAYGAEQTFTTLPDPNAALAPDVRISLTAPGNSAAVGDDLLYLAQLENAGTATATGVVLNVPLPENMEFVVARLNAGPAAQAVDLPADVVDGVIVITVGDIPAADVRLVEIILRALASGPVTLTAAAAWDGGSAPAKAEADQDVEVDDVYYEVVNTLAPLHFCGWLGVTPLLVLAGLVGMKRRTAGRR